MTSVVRHRTVYPVRPAGRTLFYLENTWNYQIMRITCPQALTVADLIILLKGTDITAPITFNTQWGANLEIRDLKIEPNGDVTILMKDEREEEIDELASSLVANLAIDVFQPQSLDN